MEIEVMKFMYHIKDGKTFTYLRFILTHSHTKESVETFIYQRSSFTHNIITKTKLDILSH